MYFFYNFICKAGKYYTIRHRKGVRVTFADRYVINKSGRIARYCVNKTIISVQSGREEMRTRYDDNIFVARVEKIAKNM